MNDQRSGSCQRGIWPVTYDTESGAAVGEGGAFLFRPRPGEADRPIAHPGRNAPQEDVSKWAQQFIPLVPQFTWVWGTLVLLVCAGAWAALLLGRLMVHEAAVREDHVLIESGPYRFVRHPVYAGYLALLLGSGVASLNVGVLLIWPVSFLGICIQAASEERLLGQKFGQEYERYVRRTGRLVPRFLAAEPAAAAGGGREVGSR